MAENIDLGAMHLLIMLETMKLDEVIWREYFHGKENAVHIRALGLYNIFKLDMHR